MHASEDFVEIEMASDLTCRIGARFADLVGYVTKLNDSFRFNIVTPNLPAGGQPIGRALQ